MYSFCTIDYNFRTPTFTIYLLFTILRSDYKSLSRKTKIWAMQNLIIPQLGNLFLPFRTTSLYFRTPTVYFLFNTLKSDYNYMLKTVDL